MEYKNLIFTKHVLERMKERGVFYKDVFWVFNNPDQAWEGKTPGSKKFYKEYKRKRYSLVAKKSEEGKWILLTCWVKELDGNSMKGETKRNSVGFWGNLWRMIRGK